MFFNISYLSSKYVNIAFNAAITGVAKNIPIIPQKCPNTNNPIIIVTGCNFVILLITIGWIRFPSRNCTTTITASVNIPIVGLCENATITAGSPPIYGPAYGITFVKPQNKANRNGAFSPIMQNPIALTMNINNESIVILDRDTLIFFSDLEFFGYALYAIVYICNTI